MNKQIEFIIRCAGSEKIQISLSTDDLFLITDTCKNFLNSLRFISAERKIGDNILKCNDVGDFKKQIDRIVEILQKNHKWPPVFRILHLDDVEDSLDVLNNIININLSNLKKTVKKVTLEGSFLSKEQNSHSVLVRYVFEFQKADNSSQCSSLDNDSYSSKECTSEHDSESISENTENDCESGVSESNNESSYNQTSATLLPSGAVSGFTSEISVSRDDPEGGSDNHNDNLNSGTAGTECNELSDPAQEILETNRNTHSDLPEHPEKQVSDEESALDSVIAGKPAKFLTENIAVSSVNHISSTPESIASVQTLQKNKTDADSASSRSTEEPKPAPKPKVNRRALWNNKPTPADISFPKPDSYNIGFEVPDEGLKIFGASQRGRSHAHVGSPRDDDFSILRTDNEGWNILIVADGAGSAKFSREGSKVACESISRDLNLKLSDSQDPLNLGIQQFCSDKSRPEINDLKEIKKLAYYQIVPVVKAAISSIEAVMNNCREEPVTLKDFATTLLMAVTKKIGSYYLVISFAIGDGAIVVYDEHESPVSSRIVKDGKTPYNDRSLLMNTPDSGEFAGQTRFLTMKNLFTNANDLINRISVHVVSSFTAIMLMSDGVSDAKFETEYLMSDKSNWDAFWKDLTVTGGDDSPPIRLSSEPLELSKQLLEWLNYWVVGNHDDRTIVVMYKYE